MINKISKDDYSSLITQLIRKITLVLINSRSSNKDKISTADDTFLLSEAKNNDYLDDFFSDDYHNKKQSFYLFFLEFYYHRQDFKCLLEKWTFNYSTLLENNQQQVNWKESVIFIRSIYTLARILPCYAINNIKEKEGSKISGNIDYRLYLNEKNIDRFPPKTSKVYNSRVKNSLMEVAIEYLPIEDFIQFNNDHMNTNIKIDNQVKQRQRHFSLVEKKIKPLYEVMAGYGNCNANYIDEDYFSNDSENSIKNKTTFNDNTDKDINDPKKKPALFRPISNRGNRKNPLSQLSFLSSSSSHSSNNSFQLDIIACNEDSQEDCSNKINLVLKDKKQLMNNLQLDTKDDWIEIIAEGINENISAIVSNFSLLKASLQKRTKVSKLNVVNLTQLYKSFLLKG